MFVLFISCSKLQKYIPHRFQGKWKTPAIMVCTGYDVGGDLGGGGINQLLQKWSFGVCARAARLWRALSFSDILHAHRKLLAKTDSPDCFF